MFTCSLHFSSLLSSCLPSFFNSFILTYFPSFGFFFFSTFFLSFSLFFIFFFSFSVLCAKLYVYTHHRRFHNEPSCAVPAGASFALDRTSPATSLRVHASIHQLINQSVCQSVSQSVNQSTLHPIIRWRNETITKGKSRKGSKK